MAGGRFLRGSGASGTMQADAFQGHVHGVFVHSGTHNEFPTNRDSSRGGNNLTPIRDCTSGSPVNPPPGYPYGAPRIAAETRPTNMSVVWIMRVK